MLHVSLVWVGYRGSLQENRSHHRGLGLVSLSSSPDYGKLQSWKDDAKSINGLLN